MVKVGKWIAKHRILMLIIGISADYSVSHRNGSNESKL